MESSSHSDGRIHKGAHYTVFFILFVCLLLGANKVTLFVESYSHSDGRIHEGAHYVFCVLCFEFCVLCDCL